MFALIIAVVAIVLTVAIAAATSYYGGDSLTQGRAKAEAAAFVTGAQQISGAAVMHLAMTSETATGVAELITDGYLTGAPVVKGGELTLVPDAKEIQSAVASADVCKALNEAAGFAADDIQADGSVADMGTKAYGCVETAEVPAVGVEGDEGYQAAIPAGVKFQFKY